MTTPRAPRALARVAAVALVFAGAACWAARADQLEDVLSRFDRVQESIHTLSAEFTETTTSDLLLDPISARGRFYLTKPDALRWEYSSPEEMRFVIAEDEYTGYFPERKRAERRSVQRWSEQIFRFFGVGQGSAELAKFYDIKLAPQQSGGTYLLLLEPAKRRVRKRIPEVKFWLDAETYLPTRIEYRSKNGNTRTIEFHEITLNPDLAASLYEVEIPDGVKVTRGFSGLPDFSDDSAQ
jgi:outer membrane lipoprotein-sorting protein